MKFFLCEITGRNRRCVIRRIFFLRKNKKVTDNHTILDVSGIFCRKMVSLGKKERRNQDEKSVKPLFKQSDVIWTRESSNRRCNKMLLFYPASA